MDICSKQLNMKRKISDCPLGTRFKYEENGGNYVLLETYGSGLVAKWEGIDSSRVFQGVYSLAKTKREAQSMEVFIVE